MFNRLLVATWLLLLLVGCSVPQKPLVLWPPPPDEPRLMWIDTIYSEDDFEKSGFTIFLEKMLGPKEVTPFAKPMYAASNGNGVMYVSDMDFRNVHVYDFNNRTRHLLSKSAVFKTVSGMALDKGGRLYVVDAGSRRIYVFGPDYKQLKEFTSSEFKKPVYVALNEDLGRIYVTDTLAHAVLVFDLSGNFLFKFADGGGEQGVYGPQGIAVSSEGNVVVADTLNARVNIYDSEGKFVRTFGERGDQPGQFEFPSGVAFDSAGHLYIGDARKAAVMVFTLDGKFLTFLGGERSRYDFGLSHPAGVFVDRNDRIFIADRLKGGVVIWQYLSENFLKSGQLAKDPRYKAWQEEMNRKRRLMGN